MKNKREKREGGRKKQEGGRKEEGERERERERERGPGGWVPTAPSRICNTQGLRETFLI